MIEVGLSQSCKENAENLAIPIAMTIQADNLTLQKSKTKQTNKKPPLMKTLRGILRVQLSCK